MAKRFKLRISRVFPSFNSCRSKDVADDPLPPLFRVSSNPSDLHLRAPPTSLRRHVCSAIASVGCGCSSKPRRRRRRLRRNPSPPPPPSDFHWRKEEKWHVVARMSVAAADDEEEDSSDAIYPELNATARKRHQQQQQQRNKNGSRSKSSKKKKNRTRVRISTSSADHSGWFSSDGDEDRDEYDVDDDTETLMSTSRTFSDESGRDFTSSALRTIQEQKPRKGYSGRRRVKTVRRQRKDSETEKEKEPVPCPSPETPSPARVSLFGRIGAEGKVRESVAVVKRSEDPYGDFKRSMVEMILEKEMYGVEELEQLLQCFLSLNSRAHHRVIVQAFSEIWDGLFFCSDSPRNVNGGFGGGNSKPASAAVLSLL